MMQSLRSDRHVQQLLDTFHTMIVNGKHCDIALKCLEGTVNVPGLLMAAISPLFRQLGTTSDVEVHVILPDFKVSTLVIAQWEINQVSEA